MRVFFYGLFMSEGLLREQGLNPTEPRLSSLDGFRLHIGDRAMLIKESGAVCHGYTMGLSEEEATRLYAASSVADYQPEPVVVQYRDGSEEQAITYNLTPSDKTGSNKDYARKLVEIAAAKQLPEAYIDDIARRFLK